MSDDTLQDLINGGLHQQAWGQSKGAFGTWAENVGSAAAQSWDDLAKFTEALQQEQAARRQAKGPDYGGSLRSGHPLDRQAEAAKATAHLTGKLDFEGKGEQSVLKGIKRTLIALGFLSASVVFFGVLTDEKKAPVAAAFTDASTEVSKPSPALARAQSRTREERLRDDIKATNRELFYQCLRVVAWRNPRLTKEQREIYCNSSHPH